MATQEKTWNVANRLHSQKDSDNPEVNHIIAGADEIYDDAKGAKQSDINAQTDASLADRYTKEETYSKEQLDDLITTPDVTHVSVVATNATTAVTDILPATGEANTIYRVGNWNGTQYDPAMYALYAWNGSAYVCLTVRSFVGEVYDISVNHPDGQGNPTPYADLAAALGTNGANIPADIRRGGMSIKFIKGNAQSSDNKFVQYRLMADEWTTDTNDWSFCGDSLLIDNPEYLEAKTDSEDKIIEGIRIDGTKEINVPTTFKDNVTIEGNIDNEELKAALNSKVNKVEGKGLSTNDYDNIAKAIVDSYEYLENPEFIRVYTDNDKKILWAIKQNGDIYFGVGVPTQIKDYIQSKISELSLDEYEDIVTFLGNLIEGDTLATLLGNKVDKITGKSLIDTEYANGISYIENPEFIMAFVDSENKILFGIKTDGDFYFGYGIPSHIVDYVNSQKTEIQAEIQAEIKRAKEAEDNKVDKVNGKGLIQTEVSESLSVEENPEYIKAETDSEGKVLAGRTPDGAAFENVGFSTPKLSVDGNTIENIKDQEERTEITTDSEDKVVRYRDKDGVLHENVGIKTMQLNADIVNADKVNADKVNTEKIEGLSTEGLTDLETALKANGFDRGYGDWSNYLSENGDKPLSIPMPRCAIVNITNDNGNAVWPTSKTANYEYYLEFWDMQGNYFKKPVIYNAQGNSSLSMPKKNGGFDMFDSEWDGDAFSIKFGNWVPQDSFHLKAYYADYFVGVCAIGYKLFNQITNTRDVFTNRDWKKALLPSKATIGVDCRALADFDDKYSLDNDARCFPDGFPCIIYLNGTFYGVYSWQLKKHRDNYMMSKKKPLHIHLDGVIDSDKLFGANGDSSLIGWVDVNDTGFEIRNPKPKKKKDGWDLTCIDGTKYDADTNMKEIIGEDDPLYDSTNKSHVETNKTKQAILQLSTYITELNGMENDSATDAQIRERLAEMFDIESFIDYLIFSDIVCNYDGFRKNWQWITWDGDKWYVEPYDLDGIFGWSSWSSIDYNHNRYGDDKTIPSGWIIQYYQAELEARYAELRNIGILTTDNILKIFKEWIAAIGTDNMQRNHDKWPNDRDHYSAGPALTHYDSIYRVSNWLDGRIVKCDTIYNLN